MSLNDSLSALLDENIMGDASLERLLLSDETSPVNALPNTTANQAESPSQKIEKYLQEIQYCIQTQDGQINMYTQQQKQIHSIELAKNLYDEESKLLANISAELQGLSQVFQSCYLEPSNVYDVFKLNSKLRCQAEQVKLCQSELEYLARAETPPVLATLVVEKQPFPDVMMKGQALAVGELVVKLLIAPQTKISQCSQVTANVIDPNQGKRSDTSQMIHGNCQMLDEQLTASFPIKFEKGTTKIAMHIQFSVDIEVKQKGHVIQGRATCDSFPFVVMTNAKQWADCGQTILVQDVFANNIPQVSWFQLANAIQFQFILATRQDFHHPIRCLSVYDLDFLHWKFVSRADVITKQQFNVLWNWYGKCIQVIRNQSKVNELWQRGLLYGFMGKDYVSRFLSPCAAGTFIMRFSDNNPGQIAVAYVAIDSSAVSKVKHYLIMPTDVSQQVSLPDFLRSQSKFESIVYFSMKNGVPNFQTRAKDEVLADLYRSAPDQVVGSYENRK